jgi:hypothetical protein
MSIQFLRLTAALAIALMPVLPKSALAYPAVGSAESVFCYMQTSDGRILNLNALCSSAKGTQKPQTAALNGKVVIGAMNYDGNVLAGQAINQTGRSVKGITINYAVVDRDGKEVDFGSIQAQVPIIPAGGSAAFLDTNSHPGATVKIVSVDWVEI